MFTDPAILETLTGTFALAVPEIALVGVAGLLFVLGMVNRQANFHWLVAVLGVVGAAVLAAAFHASEIDAYNHLINDSLEMAAPLLPGPFAAVIRWLTLGTGLLLLFVCSSEAVAGIAAEYYACLLIALAGVSLAARANDLASLYLALEMISVPTYVLLYLPAKSLAAQEAAAKYFLLSVLSSGIMLFGLAHIYGLAGTSNLTAVVETLANANRSGGSPLATLAMVLVFAGLGFRITAVPFHYYAPDVYQGAPTGVVAQLSVLPKIAGFVALARILGLTTMPLDALPFPATTQVPLVLWVMAAVTMSLGNAMALVQDNLKRILAYSGVAHAGYMLLGLVTATAGGAGENGNGLDALLFYLVAYILMTLGAFAVIVHLHTPARPTETIDDLAGVGTTHPVAGACLAIALLSLIGLPLTAGFAGKFLLFLGLFDAPVSVGVNALHRSLTVVAALNAAVGAVYYLRLLGVLYLRSPLKAAEAPSGYRPLVAALACAIGTIVAGTLVTPLAELTRYAAPSIKSAGK